MISEERIRPLNLQPILADRPYVLYWMQSSQRAACNHALEYALTQANLLRKPLLVYFGVTENFPEANERHYRFLLEGLRETRADLEARGIRLLTLRVSPEAGALALSRSAAMAVTDRGYLRVERAWRDALAGGADCLVTQVETNVIVPVETASGKEEYAAATLRPKIRRLIGLYDDAPEEEETQVPSLGLSLPFEALDLTDIDAALRLLNIDKSVRPAGMRGGASEGKRLLDTFIRDKLPRYAGQANDPGEDLSSGLSPYLHFGQISPLEVMAALRDESGENRDAFVEELTVRRELSMNFTQYNPGYDAYESLPAWARATLEKHSEDTRPYLYTREELDGARTHDPYWNAAQREMVLTGRMHGYMRMYWGKKLLEWGRTPREAFYTALSLNNRYCLDGRDPNSFAGIAWCFGKHDRPWGERNIFGNVRYMNAKGLERKFDMRRYLERVEGLEEAPGRT